MTSSLIRSASRAALVLCLALLFGLGQAPPLSAEDPAQPLSAALQDHLSADKLRIGSRRLVSAPLRKVYAGRGFAPLWLERDGVERRARDLLSALNGAAEEGLDPRDYAAEEMTSRLGSVASNDIAALAALDLMLSEQFLRYARDLRAGRTLSPEAESLFPRHRPSRDAQVILSQAGAVEDLPGYLARLAPDSARYRALRRGLVDYRAIAARGGWPMLPQGPSLSQGTSDPRVAVLRARLGASDDLDAIMGAAVAGGSHNYDPVLADAVRRLQARHGLEADGVVGRKTRAALNVPVEQRIAQIIVNMERWRRMPDYPGQRHILVNIAAYSLALIEDEETLLEMRVIVGHPKRQTPVFSGLMTYLDFNPTWTVPKGIAKLDILPEVQKDPSYLEQQNIRVFTSPRPTAIEIDPELINWLGVVPDKLPVTLRQDPGPGNALGRVKFMLPNEHAVYLHDTPGRDLFEHDRRAFSSGCIRLERPVELAEYLLADKPGWSRTRIDDTIDAGGTRSVSIAQPIPVHMIYVTAWAGADSLLRFREDIYGRDAALGRALLNATSGGERLAQLQ